MKKLLIPLILLLAIGGGALWYSQTEVVVDEAPPVVPSATEESEETEEPAEDNAMTMEEKLKDPAMVAELLPESIEQAEEVPADIMEKVEAMIEKAADPNTTEEEIAAMEKEVIEHMNPGQEEVEPDENSSEKMAMDAAAMIESGTAANETSGSGAGDAQVAEGEKMMEEAMDKMMADGTLMPKEEMVAKAVNKQGAFFGADAFHQVSGSAIVIPAANTVRLENFKSTNGPDLRVNIITKSGQRIDLGALKGNVGNQNYSYSADLDPADFSSIQIWCRAFNVTFGSAALN